MTPCDRATSPVWIMRCSPPLNSAWIIARPVFRLASAKCAHLRKASPCPSDGQFERRLIHVDFRQRVLAFSLTLFDQSRLLLARSASAIPTPARRFGSCGTSLPRTARLRMVWRSCLIWSGRVVRAGSASRAKRASAEGFGIGRVEAGEARRRQPVARRSRGPPAPPPAGRTGPSTHRPWRRCGAARRAVGGEQDDLSRIRRTRVSAVLIAPSSSRACRANCRGSNNAIQRQDSAR